MIIKQKPAKSVIKQKPAPVIAKPPVRSIRSVLWEQRKGATRGRLVKKFTEALYADFEEYGEDAIAACRMFSPDVYVKVIAGLMPKEVQISTEKELTDSELELALLRYIASDVAKVVEGRQGGLPQIIEGEATKEGAE